MGRWVFTALLLVVALLTFPACAGWRNSPYDKRDCTYEKEQFWKNFTDVAPRRG